jgi:hypothetical protein
MRHGQSETTESATEPAPGWHPDPQDATLLRWWDGSSWTAHTHPASPNLETELAPGAAADERRGRLGKRPRRRAKQKDDMPELAGAPESPDESDCLDQRLAADYISEDDDVDGVQIERSENGLNTTLPRKVANYLEERNTLQNGEEVEAVVGSTSQVILCTDQRLLVAKVGLMAGSTGGGRVTSFEYSEITSLSVQLGLRMGTLAVQSAGYGATQVGDYWATGKDNWQNLPNVIPWSKQWDKEFAAELAHANSRVQSAKQAKELTPSRATVGISAELERLASLHRDGLLDDEEFTAAKRQVLSAHA